MNQSRVLSAEVYKQAKQALKYALDHYNTYHDGATFPSVDKALAALEAAPVVTDAPVNAQMLEALQEIALAGMSGSGQESEEGMTAWHARRAWEFIGIAARAIAAAKSAQPAEQQPAPLELSDATLG